MSVNLFICGCLLNLLLNLFTDGAVIGTREFVDRIFNAQPAKHRGERKSGGRKMKGGDWGEGGLYATRYLKKNLIGNQR